MRPTRPFGAVADSQPAQSSPVLGGGLAGTTGDVIRYASWTKDRDQDVVGPTSAVRDVAAEKYRTGSGPLRRRQARAHMA